jgi:hypothetical protein
MGKNIAPVLPTIILRFFCYFGKEKVGRWKIKQFFG